MSENESKQRILTGTVVKRSGDKTVAVQVERSYAHPRYSKQMVKTSKYLAHDPENKAQVDDVVEIKESRPLSAKKRWVIVSK